jgi:hypothetical protein
MSHDLEDILMVIDGRKELLEDIKNAPLAVQNYLTHEFKHLQNETFFDDLIAGTFLTARGSIVRQRVRAISGYRDS